MSYQRNLRCPVSIDKKRYPNTRFPVREICSFIVDEICICVEIVQMLFTSSRYHREVGICKDQFLCAAAPILIKVLPFFTTPRNKDGLNAIFFIFLMLIILIVLEGYKVLFSSYKYIQYHNSFIHYRMVLHHFFEYIRIILLCQFLKMYEFT